MNAPAPRPAPGQTTAGLLAMLLLGDGRFPAGGHAHSAGVEAAVADGRVNDEASLEAFVAGRLETVGLVDATLAAATRWRLDQAVLDQIATLLRGLDREAAARIPVPALRATSRRLGRQLVRAAARCWPDPLFVVVADAFADGVHQSVALGCVATVVDATVAGTAALAVHHAVTTPAQAGVRLLGLDPFGVAAITARLAPSAAAVVAEAVARAGDDLAELPATSAPLCDIAATAHAAWDVRLFAT